MITLTLSAPPIAPPDDAALDAAGTALGLALPPSYRAFVRHYGFGLSLGMLIVYAPAPAGHRGRAQEIVSWSRAIGADLRDALRRGWVRAPVPPEIVERLVPFATSENGHALAWDPQARTADGELAIYAVGRGYDPLAHVADDLDAFFARALRPGMDGMFGRATFTLEPTFEPWRVVRP